MQGNLFLWEKKTRTQDRPDDFQGACQPAASSPELKHSVWGLLACSAAKPRVYKLPQSCSFTLRPLCLGSPGMQCCKTEGL